MFLDNRLRLKFGIFVLGCCELSKRYVDACFLVVDDVYMGLDDGENSRNRSFFNEFDFGTILGKIRLL